MQLVSGEAAATTIRPLQPADCRYVIPERDPTGKTDVVAEAGRGEEVARR